jgi:hypothetical protein
MHCQVNCDNLVIYLIKRKKSPLINIYNLYAITQQKNT